MPFAYCQNCREERMVLFASADTAHCGECGRPLSAGPDRRPGGRRRRRFERATETIRDVMRDRKAEQRSG